MRHSGIPRWPAALAAVGFVLAAPAVVAAQAPSPLGCWQFNGNFNSTGTNTANVVTVTGPPTATGVGVMGNAAVFTVPVRRAY